MRPHPPGPLPAGRSRDELIVAVAADLDHLPEAATALVACSGGPDSTALAFLVAEARPDLALVLAHVRHGLRDDRTDRALVRQHAAWLGIPIDVRDVEVVRDGHGIEAAAREARYRALRSIAADVGATTILIGHTADDQAETVLFRAVRGSGIDGLRGMDRTSGDLTRPLLRLRRSDVHDFVRGEGLPFIVDPTNCDRRLRRAVIRHDVLPSLEDVAPDAVGSLVRLSDLVRTDVEALQQLATPLLAEVRWFGALAAIPTSALRTAPPAVGRRALRAVLQQLTGTAPSAATVERIRTASDATAASLPGRVEFGVAGGWCSLGRSSPPRGRHRRLAAGRIAFWEPAAIGIEVQDAWDSAAEGSEGGQHRQTAFALPGVAPPPPPRLDPAVVPPGGRIEWCTILLPELDPLTVRHALPGDRVSTAIGRRTVADLLSEAHMPRMLRRTWPVVTVGERVVWVPGIAADHTLARAGLATPAQRLLLRRSSP